MADSLAIMFTALFFSLQIRHYINGGDIYKNSAPLAELALHVIVGLAMTIGLERTRMVTKNIVHDVGGKIIAGLTFLAICLGLLMIENPYFSGDPVQGGLIFNLLTLGYLMPAILAGVLAMVYQKTRPENFSSVAAVTSVVLAMVYLTLQVRFLFHGPILPRSGMSDAELYTHVVAWLLFTIVLERTHVMTKNIGHDISAKFVAGLTLLAIGFGLLMIGNPYFSGEAVQGGRIFNLLMFGYLTPAILAVVLAVVYQKTRPENFSSVAVVTSVVLAMAYLTLQVRFLFQGPVLSRYNMSDPELYTHVVVWLLFAIVLERTHVMTKNVGHDIGAKIAAGLTLLAIYAGLLVIGNPYFSGEPVQGGSFFSLLMFGYLWPAILTGVLAIIYKETRTENFRSVAAVTSVVLAMAYLTLQVRFLFQGPLLSRYGMSDAELYTYSVIWLLFAIALLLIGIVRKSQAVRLASAAVLLATIAKVFFIDLAGLTGVWRAFSFIGLGAVLVGIGLLYQRLLFPRSGVAKAPPPQTES
jgi:uncharacterized membrane protein